MSDECMTRRLGRAYARLGGIERRLGLVSAVLAVLLCAVTACSDVRPVSSFNSTNLQGSPGTADDLTTGGHGGDFRRR